MTYVVLVCLAYVFFFFFTSRRRHTSFDCDGSSDVCSPDLAAFRSKVSARRPAGPRDLLSIRGGTAIPGEAVEPVEAIRRRFISTAMSLGALSPEAHATPAHGLNRMGARSNSGEGGEDPDTYVPLPNADRADNPIKQAE